MAQPMGHKRVLVERGVLERADVRLPLYSIGPIGLISPIGPIGAYMTSTFLTVPFEEGEDRPSRAISFSKQARARATTWSML